MVKKLKQWFVLNKSLLLKVGFTLLVLVIIRLGSYLRVPGITVNKNLSEATKDSQDFFKMLAMLGGGSIDKFSIFALGLSPYITASIIVQLLSTDLIPVLTR